MAESCTDRSPLHPTVWRLSGWYDCKTGYAGRAVLPPVQLTVNITN